MKFLALFSLLVPLIHQISPQAEDYEGFVRAQEIFREAYQFTQEELDLKPQIVERLDFAWDRTPWMMGLRGKDVWGRWITDAECNLVLVKPNAGLVPCSCVWSWYFSFTRTPKKFEPYKDRTQNDITGPELFAYRTTHPTEDSGKRYFEGAQTRFFSILNEPIVSKECEDGFDAGMHIHGRKRDERKREKQLDGLTIIELESPVMDGNIPIHVPEGTIDEDISDKEQVFTIDIIFYGGHFLNPAMVFIPDSYTGDIDFLDRWRTLNNNYNLEYELLGLPVSKTGSACRDKYNTEGKQFECWRSKDYSNQMCNYSPGAAIKLRKLNEIYGIVMNQNRCPELLHDDIQEQFEVRRINSQFSLREVIKGWDAKEVERKREMIIANKAPRLYNLSIGSINYDEDIDPRLRAKLNTVVQKKYPFQHTSRSTKFRSTWFRIILLLLFWYHCCTTSRR